MLVVIVVNCHYCRGLAIGNCQEQTDKLRNIVCNVDRCKYTLSIYKQDSAYAPADIIIKHQPTHTYPPPRHTHTRTRTLRLLVKC